MTEWSTWFLLALAGGLGTLSRFGCTRLTQKFFHRPFPLGTLVVNLLGAVLVGWIWSASTHHLALDHTHKIVVFSGFFGAFTTFSTYMLDAATLLRTGFWGQALFYLLLHNLLGLGGFFLGVGLG